MLAKNLFHFLANRMRGGPSLVAVRGKFGREQADLLDEDGRFAMFGRNFRSSFLNELGIEPLQNAGTFPSGPRAW
ncbi:MAG: hypothetical protein U0894_14075 [Pirellulales bacterium]